MARAFARCRTTLRASLAAVLLTAGALSCAAIADSITGLRAGSEPASVAVTPVPITLDEGQAAQLTAAVFDRKGAPIGGQVITWTVDDTSVAAVSMTGQVAARRGGVATITATTDDGTRGSTRLTVRGAPGRRVILRPASATLDRRQFFELAVTLVDSAGNLSPGPPPTFTSSDPTIATVNSGGGVEAVDEGSAFITVRSGEAVGVALVTVSGAHVASLTITLPNKEMRVGDTEQAITVARDSTGRIIPDHVALFGSTSPGSARVEPTRGRVTGVGVGKGSITAEIGDQRATTSFHVALGPVDFIMITPAKATIIAGQTVKLRSIARDVANEELPDAVVTWTSSDWHVARVDSTGVVTGIARGIALIGATSEGKSVQIPLVVIPATDGNWARFDSELGDWIGDGNTWSYTDETASITAKANGVHVRVYVAGGEGWVGHLHLPDSLGRLQPGTYDWPKASISSDPTLGGVDWVSESRACNEVQGSATIDTVRYLYDQLAAIDFSFVQYCDGEPPLRGRIHWRPSEPPTPPLPPGPLVPIPADLWSPPSGATPAGGNWAYFKSDKGDWVGQGQTYLYATPPAAIDVNTGSAVMSAGHAAIRISQPGTGWLGELQAPNGLPRLEVGYYPDVGRYLFHDPVRGGMEWGGNGNGCNELSGWFVIDAVAYDDTGKLTALDARFEQHCEGATPALHGAIHWRASNVP